VVYPTDGNQPIAEIPLDPLKNRTGNHWHILVAGLPQTFRYGWRVDGPEGGGHRFDPTMVLLDPAATSISDGALWGKFHEPDPHRTNRRSLFIRQPFNWREDAPPRVSLEDSII